MTYIVGFGQPGINAILADTRVSWEHDGILEGRDGDLKIGLLFRGCIYRKHGFRVAYQAVCEIVQRIYSWAH